MNVFSRHLFLAISVCVVPFAAEAEVTTAPLFTDNMVLQRDAKVPVWGKASPGEPVTVSFNGQTKATKADAKGKWRVSLDPMKASAEPAILSVNRTEFKNVLVGEVWICSGQSNMEMGVGNVTDGTKEIASADNPQIRLFMIGHGFAAKPLDEFPGAKWKDCTPASVAEGGWDCHGGFSAVGYFFGRELQKSLGVPVGLIEAAWGGTPAQAWTPIAASRARPIYSGYVAQYEDAAENGFKTEDAAQRKLKDLDNVGETKGWQKPGFSVASWNNAKVPGAWSADPAIGLLNGAIWFRREIEIPKDWAGSPLTLFLGAIDDYDIVYFNGIKVGSTGPETPNWWTAKRGYKVPGKLVKSGKNILAVRVFNDDGDGGFIGAAEELKLANDRAGSIALAGNWKSKIEPGGAKYRTVPPVAQSVPAGLYNAMIAPAIPYAIKGAIWYQGEANAGKADEYRTLFPDLIKSWRAAWGQGDFPFYFVQLANFNSGGGWPEIREAQTMALSLPDTGMAVAIDIGEANDIHPKNKREVGRRLACNALAYTYGLKVAPCGPLYKSITVKDGKAILSFNHAGSGLACKGDTLKGFAVCGADKVFVRADAKIDGDSVVVSSPKVKSPVAIRYAWAENPECNLYNKEWLPASPFRTDSFSGVTLP